MGGRPDAGFAYLALAPEVQHALLHRNRAVVALESAVITHGLPYPESLDVALRMQEEVAAAGAVPATIAVLDGEIHIGLTEAELQSLATAKSTLKIGVRDFAGAFLQRRSGGTTVAATMFAAIRAGIEVFATGGIGGVHRESGFDVSADLQALARTRMIVVSAGAKTILDLAATIEVLESLGVPIVGFGTDQFPAFYARESGLQTSARVDSVAEAVAYWMRHCELGMESAILLANPIPEVSAIPPQELADWTQQASAESIKSGIRGKGLTPFLLRRIGELSHGRTLEANEALLLNNARLAGEIAVQIARTPARGEKNEG